MRFELCIFTLTDQREVTVYQSIINQLRPKMDEVVKKLTEDLQALRIGSANASLVENISVSYYGTKAPLKQMANISIPDATLIVIQPWDQNSLNDIILAIENSGIGLNPTNDGRTIRLVLPPMTQERRGEIIKMVHKMAEECRIVLRNLREEAWKKIKQLEGQKQITEDDRYRAEKDLNKIIENYNLKINNLIEKKEKDIGAI